MIKLTITETARNSLREDASTFNKESVNFGNIETLKDYLINRYGKMPKGKNKVYVDRDKKAVPVGFLFSFWNQDCSHNSKKWYQTDWICFETVITEPFDMKLLYN
jgi:hypothetical protein